MITTMFGLHGIINEYGLATLSCSHVVMSGTYNYKCNHGCNYKSWFWPSGETINIKPHGPIIMINNHKLKKTIRSYLLHFSLAIT